MRRPSGGRGESSWRAPPDRLVPRAAAFRGTKFSPHAPGLAANLLHLPREGAGVATGIVLEQASRKASPRLSHRGLEQLILIDPLRPQLVINSGPENITQPVPRSCILEEGQGRGLVHGRRAGQAARLIRVPVFGAAESPTEM